MVLKDDLNMFNAFSDTYYSKAKVEIQISARTRVIYGTNNGMHLKMLPRQSVKGGMTNINIPVRSWVQGGR